MTLLLPPTPAKLRANGTAPFYAGLPAPPTTPDLPAAVAYHAALTDRLDTLGPTLSRVDLTNLRRLERKWRRRCAGDDHRWLVAGTRPGRLPRIVEGSYQGRPDPAWEHS
jgi:hypothetical protein